MAPEARAGLCLASSELDAAAASPNTARESYVERERDSASCLYLRTHSFAGVVVVRFLIRQSRLHTWVRWYRKHIRILVGIRGNVPRPKSDP